jgi:hypothetical protein
MLSCAIDTFWWFVLIRTGGIRMIFCAIGAVDVVSAFRLMVPEDLTFVSSERRRDIRFMVEPQKTDVQVLLRW